MSLVIRKKSNKNFFHYFSIGGTDFEYSASDITIIFENNKAKLRSVTGRPIALTDGYLVGEISVYDDSTGGGVEFFANFTQLQARLVALGYPAYSFESEIVTSAEWGNISGQLELQSDLIEYINNVIGIGSNGSILINGGYFNVPNTFQYFIWADRYIINGTLYEGYISTTVTLSASDPTNDRFDLIVINSNGTFSVIEGTPAINPTIPLIDGETQLVLTTVLVEATATAPSGVTTDLVYDENVQIVGGEWDTLASAGSINLASSEQAESGVVSIKFTSAANGANVLFTTDTPRQGANLSVVKLNVYLETTSNYRFRVNLYNADFSQLTGATVTSGNYGFDANVLNQWQTVLIPASAFNGVVGLEYSKLDIFNERDNSTMFIDNIQIQEGTAPVISDIPDYTIEVVGTELRLLKNGFIHSVATLPAGGGGVESVTGQSVDNTDAANPIINAIPRTGTTVSFPVVGNIYLETTRQLIWGLTTTFTRLYSDFWEKFISGVSVSAITLRNGAVDISRGGIEEGITDLNFVRLFSGNQTIRRQDKNVTGIYTLPDRGSGTFALLEDLTQTTAENLIMTGTVNLDLSTFDSLEGLLTGNTTITVTNTPAVGETFVRNLRISGDLGTETLTLPVGWTIYGEYNVATVNKLTIEFANFTTSGLKVDCFINQPT